MLGLGVWGLGFGVRSLVLRLLGLGFGDYQEHNADRDHHLEVQGLGFRVQGAGCRVQGSGFRKQGSGFRV